MIKPSINLNQMLYNLDIGSKDWYEKLDSESAVKEPEEVQNA